MNCKKVSSAIFVTILAYFCSAQKALLDGIENPDVSKYKPLHVELENKSRYSSPVHFRHIIIIDGRADKSKMGVTRAGEKPEDMRIVLAKDFTSYLEGKINKFCIHDSGASDTVIFIVNNVWLYQTLSQASFLKQQALGVSNDRNSNCFLNIDCYSIKNDVYSPLCNIDTLVTSRGWLPNQCSHVLSDAFSAAVSFSDSMFVNRGDTNVKLSAKQFDTLLGERFNYQILKAEKLSQGIYRTYRDFLDNNLYADEIEILYEKNRRRIKSGTVPDSVINNSWGFSDGKNLFINIDGSFYRLIRASYTFDLVGPWVVEYKTSTFNKVSRTAMMYLVSKPFIDPSAFLEPSHRVVEKFKFYQLNISDGIFR